MAKRPMGFLAKSIYLEDGTQVMSGWVPVGPKSPYKDHVSFTRSTIEDRADWWASLAISRLHGVIEDSPLEDQDDLRAAIRRQARREIKDAVRIVNSLCWR